jgi:hypothetical protein
VNPFTTADTAVLRACTALSRNLQRQVGLTNYFVAKIGIGLMATSVLIDTGNTFSHVLPRIVSPLMLWINIPFLAILVWRSYACSWAETDISETPAQHPMLVSTIWDRLTWITWSVLDVCIFAFGKRHQWPVLEFADDTFFCLGSAVFYCFVAVRPLPPTKSRLRKWLETLHLAPLAPCAEESQ